MSKTCYSVGIIGIKYNESSVLQDCAEKIKKGDLEFTGGDELKKGVEPSLTRLLNYKQSSGKITPCLRVIGHESQTEALKQVTTWNRGNPNRQTVIMETESLPNGKLRIKSFICANAPNIKYTFPTPLYFVVAKKEGPIQDLHLEPTEEVIPTLQKLAAEILARNPLFFTPAIATEAARESVAEAQDDIANSHTVKIVGKLNS